MPSKHSKKTRVAYHEAGHAVMACFQRIPIVHATIVPEVDSLGHVLHPDPSAAYRERAEFGDLRLEEVRRLILVCLAGPQAERRLTGRQSNVGAGSDHHTAVGYAIRECGSGESATAFLKWLGIQAKEYTYNPHGSYWRSVEAVATALHAKGTLSGRAVQAIVREARELTITESRTGSPVRGGKHEAGIRRRKASSHQAPGRPARNGLTLVRG